MEIECTSGNARCSRDSSHVGVGHAHLLEFVYSRAEDAFACLASLRFSAAEVAYLGAPLYRGLSDSDTYADAGPALEPLVAPASSTFTESIACRQPGPC